MHRMQAIQRHSKSGKILFAEIATDVHILRQESNAVRYSGKSANNHKIHIGPDQAGQKVFKIRHDSPSLPF